ncbi:uncharacterized protein [Argopecten irradians]|uniref:uncharacterized protein n=1 Tax=Argopecten irradians TaxID=31199 RepID=UPI0037159B66
MNYFYPLYANYISPNKQPLLELEKSVYQKIGVMERLLTEMGARFDRLETVLTNQESEMAELRRRVELLDCKLRRRVELLDRAILHKDTIIDSLVERIADMNQPLPILGEDKVPQQHLNKDSSISGSVGPSLTQRVAFHVELSGYRNLHEDNTIVYDLVKVNNGNGYNSGDGIFTVPESGTYVFSWKSICEKQQYFQTVIVVNGAIMGSSFTDASHNEIYDQSTAVVVLLLSEADHIFIRMGAHWGHGSLLSRTDIGKPTFSGWKLE